MAHIVIAVFVALLELFGVLARPVSFDFLPLIVRIAVPLAIIVVGMKMREGGLATAADVLLGVLLLMFWTVKGFGSPLDHAVATMSVAVMVCVAAARSHREDGRSVNAFATAWTGLLAMVVLFVLLVAAVRTLDLAEGIGRQLR